MAISNNEYTDNMLAAGITPDDFTRALDLLGDDFELTDDPAADFRRMIDQLNEEGALPADMANWCRVFGIEHKEPEIEPVDIGPVML